MKETIIMNHFVIIGNFGFLTQNKIIKMSGDMLL